MAGGATTCPEAILRRQETLCEVGEKKSFNEM